MNGRSPGASWRPGEHGPAYVYVCYGHRRIAPLVPRLFRGCKNTGELMLVEADAEPEEDAKQLPKRRALSDELWPGSSMRRIPQSDTESRQA